MYNIMDGMKALLIEAHKYSQKYKTQLLNNITCSFVTLIIIKVQCYSAKSTENINKINHFLEFDKAN